MKLLEMGKDMKIKHSISSSATKYGGTLVVKKLCMREQTFLGKFIGGCLTSRLMIRSYIRVRWLGIWGWGWELRMGTSCKVGLSFLKSFCGDLLFDVLVLLDLHIYGQN